MNETADPQGIPSRESGKDSISTPVSPMSRQTTWIGILLLLAIGLPLRTANLSHLSFYADEETTAFATRSLVEGGEPQMPSGMSYRRGFLFTWVNSAVAGTMDLDDEGAYRMAGALLGALAAPVLFVAGTTFVGAGPAFVGGLLLAVSEWHVVFSRMARMYGVFALFFVLAAWFLWQWTTTGRRRYLVMGGAAFAINASLHLLGIAALQFALLPFLFRGSAAIRPAGPIVFVAFGAAATWAYDTLFVSTPYASFGETAGRNPPEGALSIVPTVPGAVLWSVVGIAALLTAIAVARRLFSRSDEHGHGSADGTRGRLAEWPRDSAMACFLGAAAAMAVIGQVGGAVTAAVVWLLLDGRSLRDLWSTDRTWIATGAAVLVAWSIVSVVGAGFAEGLKAVLYFPYPYTLRLAAQFPVAVGLAAVWVTLSIFRAAEGPRTRALAVSLILPLSGMGIISRWQPPRYFFHFYPILLVLAGAGLVWICAALLRSKVGDWRPIALASVLALSGLTGRHGLPQAVGVTLLDHGDTTHAGLHMYDYRPDHAAPGLFVRDRLESDDVVIAVDVLEQRWYAGRVDYWLRSLDDSGAFRYESADGKFREIYVSAELMGDRADIDRVLSESGRGRVWVITSGETDRSMDLSFSPGQLEWMDELERSGAEVFLGRDGRTKVYCLRCSPGVG